MLRYLAAGVAALLAYAPVAAGAGDDLDAFRTLAGSQVSFSLGGGYSNATLSVAGPVGFLARNFSKSGNPSIDLIRSKAKADGLYTYEITAASPDTVAVVNDEDNGRGTAEKSIVQRGVSASGTFMVKNGLIVELSSARERD